MKKKCINNLLNSVSTDSTNKFKSIMNSPNFGNQQILVQSCCFFDSDRSQTPHATNTIIKDFNIKVQKKSGSPTIPHTKQRIYHYKNLDVQTIVNSNKLYSNNDIIQKSKNDEDNILTINKLKKDNKALKSTIKNLTSQLDRVCSIAEKAKNNEKNSLKINNYNEQEKNDLLKKIENLTKENKELRNRIEKKEEEFNNYKLNNKIEEINNQNKIIDNEKKHRRFVSEISNEFENIKQINNSLSITVNREINDNKKYKFIINKLNQENENLKKKIDEQINKSVNILKEKINEKDSLIQNLTNENNDLKNNINNLETIKIKYDEVCNKNKILNEINNKYNILLKETNEKNVKLKLLENIDKENNNLSNKLVEAGKTISDYMRKYDEITKKYYKLKSTYKKQENILNELNNQVSDCKNKYEKILEEQKKGKKHLMKIII